jgi:hypothetical protein
VFAGLVIATAACDSSDGGGSPVRAGIAGTTEQLGAQWQSPERPWLVDETITDRCGDARNGLAAPTAGLISAGTSPMLTPVIEEPPNGTPAATGPLPGSPPSTPPSTEPQARDRYGNVRVSVLVYRDDATARAAFDRLTPEALEECFVVATNRYLVAAERTHGVPDATADSFETTSAPFAAGDEAILTGIFFGEEVTGGFDNSHNAAQLTARAGRVIVTALAVSNTQMPDTENPSALARALGVVALQRAAGAA